MYKFKSSDIFEIGGRGIVYACTADQFPKEYWDAQQLVGNVVEVDGKKGKVRAVDRFAIGVSPDRPYRLSFGLLMDFK